MTPEISQRQHWWENDACDSTRQEFTRLIVADIDSTQTCLNRGAIPDFRRIRDHPAEVIRHAQDFKSCDRVLDV